MSNTTSRRPDHLPDFKHPPLNEVVIGVQYAPPTKYQQIFAKEVWELFRNEYPEVLEQAPIPPVFETFGLPTSAGKLSFVTGASHDRFWFLRPKGNELIQFQNDHFLHNWRKAGDDNAVYPRFEYMIDKFKDELTHLQRYMNLLAPQTLIINQCEVSYVNHILDNETEQLIASKWLRFLTFGDNDPNDIRVVFREIIRNEEGKPQGRLICEAVSALNESEQPIIAFTLTVRGAPVQPNIESALDFILKGRERIVSRFAELTTDFAHTKWERSK